MSSTDFRVVREPTGDPLAKYVKKMQQALANKLTKDNLENLDSPEDIYSDSQTTDSAAKFNTLSHNHSFRFNIQYYPIEEKEYLWVKAYNMGTKLKDFGFYEGRMGETVNVKGDPILIDGTPFDPGSYIESLGVKSHALRMNRPEQTYSDAFTIPSFYGINVDTSAFSIFIRFRTFAVNDQNGFRRTLVAKVDDLTPTSGYQIGLNEDRRVVIFVKEFGVLTKKETTTNVILDNVIYDLWVTYTDSTNTIRCFLGRSDTNTLSELSLSTTGYSESWDTANTDLWFGRKGGGTIRGEFYGDFYDLKFNNNRAVSYDSHGTSVRLNGSDDNIDLGNHADLWSAALNKFSFSLWVYGVTAPSSVDEHIFGSGGASNHGKRLLWQNSDDKVKFNIKSSGGSNIDAIENTAMGTGTWTHYVATYDKTLGSDNVKLYKNKVLQTDKGNLTETISFSDIAKIGSSSISPLVYVKDFRWWTEKALNQTEVNDVYDDKLTAPTPSYHLRLTEGLGTPTDRVSNIKTATLLNGAAWINSEVSNHWENKMSTSGIQYNQVALANHAATYAEFTQIYSFTSTSFTSTSFTAAA